MACDSDEFDFSLLSCIFKCFEGAVRTHGFFQNFFCVNTVQLNNVYVIRLKVPQALFQPGSCSTLFRSLVSFGRNHDLISYVLQRASNLFFTVTVSSGSIKVVDASFKGISYNLFCSVPRQSDNRDSAKSCDGNLQTCSPQNPLLHHESPISNREEHYISRLDTPEICFQNRSAEFF